MAKTQMSSNGLLTEDKIAYGNRYIDELVKLVDRAGNEFATIYRPFSANVIDAGTEDVTVYIDGVGLYISLTETDVPAIGGRQGRREVVPAWSLSKLGWDEHEWRDGGVGDTVVEMSVHRHFAAEVRAALVAIATNESDLWIDKQFPF